MKTDPKVAHDAAVQIELANFAANAHPVHIHQCTAQGAEHRWPCQSDYCLQIVRLCEHHGGPKVREADNA